MKFRELPGAISDLDDALGYYGRIGHFFAQVLMDEIRAAKRLIAEYPSAWKSLPDGLRAFHLHRYPYTIIYRAEHNEILIVAYAHFRRRPGYWNERKSEEKT